MRFVLELWPDIDEYDDPQALLTYAVESVKRNPDLIWTILDDDGRILFDEVVLP